MYFLTIIKNKFKKISMTITRNQLLNTCLNINANSIFFFNKIYLTIIKGHF